MGALIYAACGGGGAPRPLQQSEVFFPELEAKTRRSKAGGGGRGAGRGRPRGGGGGDSNAPEVLKESSKSRKVGVLGWRRGCVFTAACCASQRIRAPPPPPPPPLLLLLLLLHIGVYVV